MIPEKWEINAVTQLMNDLSSLPGESFQTSVQGGGTQTERVGVPDFRRQSRVSSEPKDASVLETEYQKTELQDERTPEIRRGSHSTIQFSTDHGRERAKAGHFIIIKE